jgi:NDP-sugar pyrophosphorylase family protein
MLEVGGQPIIAYNLAMLAAGGFRDVVINLHHLPDVIRDFVGTGERWGLRVSYSEELELLGTGGALIPVLDRFASETFAIVFADNLNQLDLTDMLHRHRATGALVTIAVSRRDDVSQSGVTEIGSDDRIVRFIEKPQAGKATSGWINAGVVLAEPSLIAVLPPKAPFDLSRDVLAELVRNGDNVYAYPMTGAHLWFDRVEDYERAKDGVRE